MGDGEEPTGGDTRSPVMRGLALLAEGIEELLYATTAGPLSRSELLAALRDLEVARRKIPAIEHQLLTQCADEGVAGELGEKNLTALLHHTLRISQADARARLRAAERLGPRCAITGEPLEPRQATVASAQYAGLINTRHAAIIDQILTKIPAAAPPPTPTVPTPTGRSPTSSPTPTTSAPTPAANPNFGHDALEALLDMALSSGQLGNHRGLPTTVIITMTLDQLEQACGQATTASGAALPITDALHLAEHAHPVLTVFDHTGRPLHLGRGKRLATADQRLALIAADRGCTKPGCTAPPDRCEVHHTNEWADDGRTDIDQLTLACDGDHALIGDGPNGWNTTIGAHPDHPGRCAWTAPKHLDPAQRPQINHAHHLEELLGEVGKTDSGDEDPP